MTTRLNRFGIPVGLSLVVAIAGCGGSGTEAKSAAGESGGGAGHAEVGKPAPDLSIQTLNGKGKIKLESLQGKVVVVDFWATWCGPCKQSFPKLEELSKKVGDKVEIVGVSVDDEKKGILEFAKETGATFAIGWDEGHAIASRWKVGTMPTTFILDGTGTVRYIHDGYHDGETKAMEKEIAMLSESKSNAKVAKAEEKESDESDTKKEDSSTKKDEATASADSSSTSTSDEERTDAAPKKKSAKKGTKPAAGAKPSPKKPKKKTPATTPASSG